MPEWQSVLGGGFVIAGIVALWSVRWSFVVAGASVAVAGALFAVAMAHTLPTH